MIALPHVFLSRANTYRLQRDCSMEPAILPSPRGTWGAICRLVTFKSLIMEQTRTCSAILAVNTGFKTTSGFSEDLSKVPGLSC